MAAVIGALRVVIGADSAALDKGLKDAQGSLKSFAANAASTAAGIGLEKWAEKLANNFTHALKGSFEAIDQLGKSALKIGVPIEELSKLEYAAKLSDLSMEQMVKGAGKLSQALAQLAGGGSSDATRALTAMGFTSKTALQPLSQSIEDIAEKFSTFKDGIGRTNAAVTLFGKAGKSWIPMLVEGKDGLHQMFEEAEKLGLVVSKETAAAVTHFNDDLKSLHMAGEGVSRLVTAELAPAFAVLSKNIKEAVIEGGYVPYVAQSIISLLTGVAGVVVRVGGTFTRMAEEASAAMQIMRGLGEFSDGGAAEIEKGWARIVAAGKKYHLLIEDTDESVKKFLEDAKKLSEEWSTHAKRTEEAANGTEKHKNALDAFLNSQKKAIAGHQADLEADKAATGVKEGLRVKYEALQIATDNQIKQTPAQVAAIASVSAAAEILGLKLGNIALIGQANPYAALQANLDLTNQKLAQGGLSLETYNMLSEQSGKLQQKIWTESAASVQTSTESIFESMSQLSSNWARLAKVGKAIGAVIAFVNAYVAASEALAKAVFPANIAIAAGVLAKGLAMVVAIKSAAVPSAAMGGAFKVPGGYGGGDKVLAPMMLEPGELVEVSSNRQGGYQSGGDGGRTLSINLQGETFGRETLRQIAKGIEQLVGDGLRIDLKTA